MKGTILYVFNEHYPFILEDTSPNNSDGCENSDDEDDCAEGSGSDPETLNKGISEVLKLFVQLSQHMYTMCISFSFLFIF